MNGPSIPADVDALFKLPLGEFTSARNALVAQLKKDGRQAAASQAKSLARPSVSAWVVNQLYWRHRKTFDRLLEAGDRLRRAHPAQRTGDNARDPKSVRRALVTELAGIAADLLREAGHGDTRNLIRRVTSTLEALSSYGRFPGAPAAGRLTDDLEPAGFEAVLGHLPESGRRAAGGPKGHLRSPGAQEERKRLIAAKKAAVRAAERALKLARKEAERAAKARAAAATRAKAIEGERAQMEIRFARISSAAGAAQAEARDAAAKADQAARAAEGAARTLEKARD
jgi:hypothetical protein